MPSPSPSALTKRIPSLAEWLGNGARCDGFEQWVALTLDQSADPDGTSDEAKMLRIAQTFAVACVEQMSREAQRDPSPEGVSDALAMWARAAGFTTVCAVASVVRDDAPFRRIARTLAEEFKIGAKMAADKMADQQGGRADAVA